MKSIDKAFLGLVMSAALLFGFLDPLWPESIVSFKRLHIFLFNLMSGGALVLYFSEGAGAVSRKVKLYFLLTFLYAVTAAARIYPATLVLSAAVFALVESVRIRRFSFLPFDLFGKGVPVAEKFKHASLLCLSSATVFSSLVILNNEYWRLVHYEKLTLDVFFLGFSFPVSLIVFSIMFSFMTGAKGSLVRLLEELSFWLVNLGVIAFFAFIIFGLLIPEIAVAALLTVTVVVVFVLFLKTAPAAQQKSFLLSGISFLLATAITGVFYLLKYFLPGLAPYKDFVLTLHAMVSLYGWNLSGLFIIVRWSDFPIRLNSGLVIFLHWAVCFLLAPVGKHLPAFALLAMPAYILLLGIVLFGKGASRERAAGIEPA